MSGFFDKTREDMQYIFKKGSTLSQSEKKHKLRAWATVIGIALVVVQLVFTVLTLLKLYKLDILPLKYIAAIDAVLVLVAIYDFLSQFTKTHIIGKVISILLSAVLLYTFLFTSKVDTTLDKISSNGNNVQEITDVVDVVVLKKDKAQSLSDTLSYTFGYNSTVDADDNQDAIQKINFNNNADIKTKEYTTWEDIIPALEAGTDIQAMLINDNTLSSFDEEYEEFLDSIRIVGTIELKRTIELSESDKKVNEEPFVIYISGNDEEGKILSTGRSDVNILCVIHPITRQVLLITTPRDAYINLTNPGTGAQGYDKLTHAGQWGIEGSILNLQNLYDLNIDYYVKINFTGCETIVDALGGVTINSSVDFVNGLEAAPTRYHYVIGDNECNGEQTLAFCRERNAFLDGDYQRGRNQLAALTAIINKLTSPAILAKYSALLDSVGDMLYTNMPVSDITSLVKGQLANSRSWNIQTYSTGAEPDSRLCQHFGSYRSVSLLYQADVDIAKQLAKKIINGDIFDAQEYYDEEISKVSNPTGLMSLPNTSKSSSTNKEETSAATSTKSSSTTKQQQTTTKATAAPTEAATTTAAPTQTPAPDNNSNNNNNNNNNSNNNNNNSNNNNNNSNNTGSNGNKTEATTAPTQAADAPAQSDSNSNANQAAAN